MEERNSLARPYALAAFKQALEEGKPEEWADMLRFLAAASSDRMMAGLIADPRVEESRLAQVVLDIGEGRLSKTGSNFVKIIAANRRLSLLREISELFGQELAEHQGRGRVEVVSAYDLDAEQQERIKKAMSKRLGCEVDLTVSIDESLIGGVVIRAGDLVIDGSLRGRLKRLDLSLA